MEARAERRRRCSISGPHLSATPVRLSESRGIAICLRRLLVRFGRSACLAQYPFPKKTIECLPDCLKYLTQKFMNDLETEMTILLSFKNAWQKGDPSPA